MIFVSYATKNQDMADRIVRGLEAAGLRCWISSRDLKLGMDYQASIVQALDSAAVVLLLLSRAANESLEVPKELSLAGERRKVVIPVRLEDVKPEGALAYQATNVQRIDLFRDFNAQMEALYQRLHGILGDVPPPPPAPPRPARKWRWAAVAVGLVLLASGGVAAVMRTACARRGAHRPPRHRRHAPARRHRSRARAAAARSPGERFRRRANVAGGCDHYGAAGRHRRPGAGQGRSRPHARRGRRRCAALGRRG
jgi:hypothetical protein